MLAHANHRNYLMLYIRHACIARAEYNCQEISGKTKINEVYLQNSELTAILLPIVHVILFIEYWLQNILRHNLENICSSQLLLNTLKSFSGK